MAFKLSPLTVVILSYLFTLVTAACYFPDGTVSPNDSPCRDDTDNALCCGQGYACLSNGICQATGNELEKEGATEFVRGGCTDKSYRSSACPSFCSDPELDNVGGGMGIAKCENTDKDLYFCINADAQDEEKVSCEEEKGVLFFAGTPTAYTTIGVAPTSTAEESATSTADDETSSTSTSEATETADSTQPTETGSSDDSDNKGAIIGGVVGGVAGIALITGLAWWLLRRRKSKQSYSAAATSEPQAGVHPQMYSYNGQTYFKDQPEQPQMIHEMPNNASAAELPASSYR